MQWLSLCENVARGDDCSAAAWILEGRVQHEDRLIEFPVAYCGKFMDPPVSSFVAEAIALESCTEIFAKLVIKLVSSVPAFKKAKAC